MDDKKESYLEKEGDGILDGPRQGAPDHVEKLAVVPAVFQHDGLDLGVVAQHQLGEGGHQGPAVPVPGRGRAEGRDLEADVAVVGWRRRVRRAGLRDSAEEEVLGGLAQIALERAHERFPVHARVGELHGTQLGGRAADEGLDEHLSIGSGVLHGAVRPVHERVDAAERCGAEQAAEAARRNPLENLDQVAVRVLTTDLVDGGAIAAGQGLDQGALVGRGAPTRMLNVQDIGSDVGFGPAGHAP